MPTIQRLRNFKVCMYADDHDPPHFHVLGPGWSGVIDLDTHTVCRGEISKAGIPRGGSVGEGK